MAGFNDCAQCGRKLRNALFCPDCGQAVCSSRCFDEHEATHRYACRDPSQPKQKDQRTDSNANCTGRAHPQRLAYSLAWFGLRLAGRGCFAACQQLT
jgi:hypothetical protein